jgi:hypothetical protein
MSHQPLRGVIVIYHLVRFALKPDAPEEQVEHALDLMRKLGREQEGVDHYAVGRDFGGEFQVGAMYAIKDIDAYRTYMYDKLHQEIDTVGLPLASNMVSFDLTDDPDPGIGDKIAKVHSDRFGERPELLDLVENLESYEGSGMPGSGTKSS